MKLKKRKILQIIFVIVLLIFIIIFNLIKRKNYEVEYKVDKYNIVENYNHKIYTFRISNEDNSFSFLKNIKYTKKHKLINNIKEIKLDNEMKEKLNFVDREEDEEKTYNNLKINNLLDYNYLVWNYKGFDLISQNSTETINLFNSDIYDIPLSKIVNNYLLIADYDSKYNFNKFYVINVLKGTKDEFKIKDDISFDSYILGSYKESIYLVDRKNKIEYEIVPHKKKIRKVGTESKQGIIYTENGFERISLTKLVSKEYSFYDDNLYNYKIIDNKLVQELNKDKMIVSNKDIKDIIAIKEDNVLYLVDDTLYFYNILYGEIKVMTNFEWNFNYKNNIYFY